LRLAPSEVLHVGDHAGMDAGDALGAGFRAYWISCDRQPRQRDDIHPDLEFTDLTVSADWRDAQLPLSSQNTP
jgi:putative hydrolase of the HAD superfamily